MFPGGQPRGGAPAYHSFWDPPMNIRFDLEQPDFVIKMWSSSMLLWAQPRFHPKVLCPNVSKKILGPHTCANTTTKL